MNITVSVTPTANAAIMLAVPMAKQATSILISNYSAPPGIAHDPVR
jgi:hypothetical protein